MTKVCHVTSAHLRNDPRVFQKECKSLFNEGYDVSLIVNDSSPNEISYGVKIFSTGINGASRFNRFFRSHKAIFKLVKQVDAKIYHFHDPDLLFLAYLLKKKGKSVVVFDSHESMYKQILEKDYISKPLRLFIAKVYRLIETYICKRIDAVIFPCPINGQHPFEQRSKISIYLDNYPILDEIRTFKSPNYFDSNCHNATVVTIGGITKNRGIENLVKACYKADARLLLGGVMDSGDFCTGLKNSQEFNSAVDYLGGCSREEVLNAYASSAMGASTILPVGQYPTLCNMPTKVYEFMMSSLPFIVSNFSYAQQFVSENKCGICVDPEDVDDIAEKIRFLIQNPDISKEMGNNGRQAIIDKYNWEKEKVKLFNLYETLL